MMPLDLLKRLLGTYQAEAKVALAQLQEEAVVVAATIHPIAILRFQDKEVNFFLIAISRFLLACIN